MSCHGYEGVMSVLCTPLQVKCYPQYVRTDLLPSLMVNIINVIWDYMLAMC